MCQGRVRVEMTRVASALAGLLLAGCSAQGFPGVGLACDELGTCPEGLACVAGVCATPPIACSAASDCQGGTACVLGLCRRPCVRGLGEDAPFRVAQGEVGLYGSPYVWIGPRGAPVWEVYRKRVDTSVPPRQGVVATRGAAPGRVRFDGLVKGCVDESCTYHAPGLFLATRPGRESPREAPLTVVSVTRRGETGDLPTSIDLRLGFAVHRPGGGGELNKMVVSFGGDLGQVDPFFGGWRTDGLYQHWSVTSGGAYWTAIDQLGPNLVSGVSSANEQQRTDYSPQLSFTGVTVNSAGYYVTDLPSTEPLALSWRIVSTPSTPPTTALEVDLGPRARVTWVFDDGAERDGLSNPGNPDQLRYSSPTLPLDQLVPFAFVGLGGLDGSSPPPAGSVELAVGGAAPLPTVTSQTARVGEPVTFRLAWIGADGVSDEVAAAATGTTVEVSSSDPGAVLEPSGVVRASDLGTGERQVTFHTPGMQYLIATDTSHPALTCASEGVRVLPRP